MKTQIKYAFFIALISATCLISNELIAQQKKANEKTPKTNWDVPIGNKVPKQYLLNKKKIIATMGEDFAFDIKYEVTSFQFLFAPKKGTAILIKAKNCNITEGMRACIRKAKKNDLIIIEKIKAKGPNGEITLAPIIYSFAD